MATGPNLRIGKLFATEPAASPSSPEPDGAVFARILTDAGDAAPHPEAAADVAEPGPAPIDEAEQEAVPAPLLPEARVTRFAAGERAIEPSDEAEDDAPPAGRKTRSRAAALPAVAIDQGAALAAIPAPTLDRPNPALDRPRNPAGDAVSIHTVDASVPQAPAAIVPTAGEPFAPAPQPTAGTTAPLPPPIPSPFAQATGDVPEARIVAPGAAPVASDGALRAATGGVESRAADRATLPGAVLPQPPAGVPLLPVPAVAAGPVAGDTHAKGRVPLPPVGVPGLPVSAAAAGPVAGDMPAKGRVALPVDIAAPGKKGAQGAFTAVPLPAAFWTASTRSVAEPPMTASGEADTSVPAPAPAPAHGAAAMPIAPAPAIASLLQPLMLDAGIAPALPQEGPQSAREIADAVIDSQLDLAHEGEWLDRLARDIARTAGGEGKLRFRLAPETLGTLHVELAQAAAGTAVRLTVESEQARALLADAQHRLVAEARIHGVRITETHVDLAGGGHHPSGDPRRDGDSRPEQIVRTVRAAAAGDHEPPARPARRASERFA